jgi:hypothetical protein
MSDGPDAKKTADRIISGTLHRVRRGHAKTFVEKPPVPREPTRRPARVAIALALAHKIEEAIQRGVARDRADVARRLGLTRARVTQLLDLTLLAPEIQHLVLDLQSIDGIEPLSERSLRGVAHGSDWSFQRKRWDALLLAPGTAAR